MKKSHQEILEEAERNLQLIKEKQKESGAEEGSDKTVDQKKSKK